MRDEHGYEKKGERKFLSLYICYYVTAYAVVKIILRDDGTIGSEILYFHDDQVR